MIKIEKMEDLIELLENWNIEFRITTSSSGGRIVMIKGGVKYLCSNSVKQAIISSLDTTEEIVSEYTRINELVLPYKSKIKLIRFSENILTHYSFPYLLIYF